MALIELSAGFYVVKDYEYVAGGLGAHDSVGEPSDEIATLAVTKDVYRLTAYGNDENKPLYFTGTILWQTIVGDGGFYELSALNTAAAVGQIPASALVVAIDDD